MEFETHTLPNGIRIIHSQVAGSQVAHCGLFLNAGSRDEEPHEQGIAHFIEHTIFKGTKKRKAFHILSRLDAVGGELNAYTTKEYTCIYASFLNEHYSRAIDLIADITFHATFPEKELAREKEVIIDEINSYLDSPSEQIFDEFEEQVFAGHAIGRNILGTIGHVKRFTAADVKQFIASHHGTNQIVFSSIGSMSFKQVKRWAEKYLGPIPAHESELSRQPYAVYQANHREEKRDGYQSHFMLGTVAPSAVHSQRRAMVLLNNILGGPAMNSRLNLGIREKYGFTYNIESNYTGYSDTGFFSLYLGTDPAYLDRSIKLAKKELSKLRNTRLGNVQLQNAKQQLIGQIALNTENRSNTMLSLGRSLLLFNHVASLEDIYAAINAITSSDLLEIANEVFDEKQLSTLTYLNRK